MNEREVGQILEGVKNLDKRYTNQENKVNDIEKKIVDLHTAFVEQPRKCFKVLEEKFVTKESIKPMEDMYKGVKNATIFVLCSALACIAVFLIYIKEQL